MLFISVAKSGPDLAISINIKLPFFGFLSKSKWLFQTQTSGYTASNCRQFEIYFNSTTTSSTPRTLEYVTIDRGSATRPSSGLGTTNQFVTPLPQDETKEEDDENDDLERPRSGLQSSIRDLE